MGSVAGRAWAIAVALAFGAAAVAVANGGPGSSPPGETKDAAANEASAAAALFSAPLAVDDLRPGGEPIVLVHPSGTLILSAHSGETHFKPTANPAPLAVGATGGVSTQVWRSTDDGATWQFVGLPLVHAGPRGATLGWSDPDLALDAAGNVYHTELYLGSVSVSKSTDQGATWLQSNPAASPIPGDDRQWIATHGTHPEFGAEKVYLVFNHLALGWRFLTSSDGGLTFPSIRSVPAAGPPGKMAVDPRDGTVYIGQEAGVWRSTNGGATWTFRGTGHATNCCVSLSGPVVDAAGNLYHVWSERSNGIWLAVSSTKGDSWKAVVKLSNFAGQHIFPWIAAGAAGRIGVAWLASSSTAHAESNAGPWHVYYAVSTNANTTAPTFGVTQVSMTPAHTSGVCTGGLTCWAFLGDRRLGDYLTVASDGLGRAHIAYPSTQTNEATSHVMYAKQVGGDLLKP